MASAFSHAVSALALGTAFHRKGDGRRFWALGVLGAVLPDVDAIGFAMGVPYGSVLGHRGFTHSLLFAALTALAAAWAFEEEDRRRIGLYLFLATASHGLLDAMTTGGMGVGFFIPFENGRHFLPWRPIVVSPISIPHFFGARGLVVLRSELRWVWLPSLLFAAACLGVRRLSPRPACLPPPQEGARP